MKQPPVLVAQLPNPDFNKTNLVVSDKKKKSVTEEGDFSTHSHCRDRLLLASSLQPVCLSGCPSVCPSVRLSVRLFACISAVPIGYFLKT